MRSSRPGTLSWGVPQTSAWGAGGWAVEDSPGGLTCDSRLYCILMLTGLLSSRRDG